MCKKHTQTLKSDRFAPNFVWNLSEFWVFLKSVKIKVLFVSYRARGNIRKRSVFLSAPIFVWKIYPQNSYLANLPWGGGRSENAGKFLSSPNGLFGFLPTFYPQKTSILTEVVGEDKKTQTIFSSLTKILWSFFHKTASQGLFRCFLPLIRTLP